MSDLFPRIVTPGVVPAKPPPAEQWYKTKCSNCGCVFEYTKKMRVYFETHDNWDDGHYYLVCPQKGCGKGVDCIQS